MQNPPMNDLDPSSPESSLRQDGAVGGRSATDSITGFNTPMLAHTRPGGGYTNDAEKFLLQESHSNHNPNARHSGFDYPSSSTSGTNSGVLASGVPGSSPQNVAQRSAMEIQTGEMGQPSQGLQSAASGGGGGYVSEDSLSPHDSSQRPGFQHALSVTGMYVDSHAGFSETSSSNNFKRRGILARSTSPSRDIRSLERGPRTNTGTRTPPLQPTSAGRTRTTTAADLLHGGGSEGGVVFEPGGWMGSGPPPPPGPTPRTTTMGSAGGSVLSGANSSNINNNNRSSLRGTSSLGFSDNGAGGSHHAPHHHQQQPLHGTAGQPVFPMPSAVPPSRSNHKPEWLSAAQRVKVAAEGGSGNARLASENVLPAEQNNTYGLQRTTLGLTEAQLRNFERTAAAGHHNHSSAPASSNGFGNAGWFQPGHVSPSTSSGGRGHISSGAVRTPSPGRNISPTGSGMQMNNSGGGHLQGGGSGGFPRPSSNSGFPQRLTAQEEAFAAQQHSSASPQGSGNALQPSLFGFGTTLRNGNGTASNSLHAGGGFPSPANGAGSIFSAGGGGSVRTQPSAFSGKSRIISPASSRPNQNNNSSLNAPPWPRSPTNSRTSNTVMDPKTFGFGAGLRPVSPTNLSPLTAGSPSSSSGAPSGAHHHSTGPRMTAIQAASAANAASAAGAWWNHTPGNGGPRSDPGGPTSWMNSSATGLNGAGARLMGRNGMSPDPLPMQEANAARYWSNHPLSLEPPAANTVDMNSALWLAGGPLGIEESGGCTVAHSVGHSNGQRIPSASSYGTHPSSAAGGHYDPYGLALAPPGVGGGGGYAPSYAGMSSSMRKRAPSTPGGGAGGMGSGGHHSNFGGPGGNPAPSPGGPGGGGGGGGGGGRRNPQPEERKAKKRGSIGEREERNIKSMDFNALHAIPWEQRGQMPMTGFGTRFFALLATPRFWEKIDWTFRGSLLTVVPTMILSLNPGTKKLIPVPSMFAFMAFWITMPTFGSGLRELAQFLKGIVFSGVLLLIVIWGIRPGPAWLSLLLIFFFTVFYSFVGEVFKKNTAYLFTATVMQYINDRQGGLVYLVDSYITTLVSLCFGFFAFLFPFIRWSSEHARHYTESWGNALSIEVQGFCSSFWVERPTERELNLVHLRQLRATATMCAKKVAVALEESEYEPHTGAYVAKMTTRYTFCQRIHNILGSMEHLIEALSENPSVIDTPMCNAFGSLLRDDLVIIASAMDSMILKIVDFNRLVTPSEIIFFHEARQRFQDAVSSVREDVILNNENYETEVADVYLGYFLFSVDALCEVISSFKEVEKPRSNFTYLCLFFVRDAKSVWKHTKSLYFHIIHEWSITRRAKEAIKLGLCMSLPGIFQIYALDNDATSPLAGATVIALIYHGTGAESFHYASNRLLGTVLGSLLSLVAVELAGGKLWLLYIFIIVFSFVGAYVQAAPGFYALGNSIVCSVISIMTQYNDNTAAMERIKQNCFAILLYFALSSVLWPMRAHTKVKMGLDTSLRCLRETCNSLLRNLDMPDDAAEVCADAEALMKEFGKKIAVQIKYIPGAVEEPTLGSVEFPERHWHKIVEAERNIESTLNMMRSAYSIFMSKRADAETAISVHWVVLHRIAPHAADLADLIHAMVDLHLLLITRATIVPISHLTRLRLAMQEAHRAILEMYIVTLQRKVDGESDEEEEIEELPAPPQQDSGGFGHFNDGGGAESWSDYHHGGLPPLLSPPPGGSSNGVPPLLPTHSTPSHHGVGDTTPLQQGHPPNPVALATPLQHPPHPQGAPVVGGVPPPDLLQSPSLLHEQRPPHPSTAPTTMAPHAADATHPPDTSRVTMEGRGGADAMGGPASHHAAPPPGLPPTPSNTNPTLTAATLHQQQQQMEPNNATNQQKTMMRRRGTSEVGSRAGAPTATAAAVVEDSSTTINNLTSAGKSTKRSKKRSGYLTYNLTGEEEQALRAFLQYRRSGVANRVNPKDGDGDDGKTGNNSSSAASAYPSVGNLSFTPNNLMISEARLLASGAEDESLAEKLRKKHKVKVERKMEPAAVEEDAEGANGKTGKKGGEEAKKSRRHPREKSKKRGKKRREESSDEEDELEEEEEEEEDYSEEDRPKRPRRSRRHRQQHRRRKKSHAGDDSEEAEEEETEESDERESSTSESDDGGSGGQQQHDGLAPMSNASFLQNKTFFSRFFANANLQFKETDNDNNTPGSPNRSFAQEPSGALAKRKTRRSPKAAGTRRKAAEGGGKRKKRGKSRGEEEEEEEEDDGDGNGEEEKDANDFSGAEDELEDDGKKAQSPQHPKSKKSRKGKDQEEKPKYSRAKKTPQREDFSKNLLPLGASPPSTLGGGLPSPKASKLQSPQGETGTAVAGSPIGEGDKKAGGARKQQQRVGRRDSGSDSSVCSSTRPEEHTRVMHDSILLPGQSTMVRDGGERNIHAVAAAGEPPNAIPIGTSSTLEASPSRGKSHPNANTSSKDEPDTQPRGTNACTIGLGGAGESNKSFRNTIASGSSSTVGGDRVPLLKKKAAVPRGGGARDDDDPVFSDPDGDDDGEGGSLPPQDKMKETGEDDIEMLDGMEDVENNKNETFEELSFFDNDRGDFVLTNSDIHSLEAFFFGTKALVMYLHDLQRAIIDMQHQYDLNKRL